MPDVHFGIGATVGSVVPTEKAIIQPRSAWTSLRMMASRPRWSRANCRTLAPLAHGDRAARCRTAGPRMAEGRSRRVGTTSPTTAPRRGPSWCPGTLKLIQKHQKLGIGNDVNHSGTLGTGNHFIEVCLESATTYVHAALGLARRGQSDRHVLIELAKHDMRQHSKICPTRTSRTSRKHAALRRLRRGGELGAAVRQDQRDLMMKQVIAAARQPDLACGVELGALASTATQLRRARAPLGKDVFVTRQGRSARASSATSGINPRSMGARRLPRARQGERIVLLVAATAPPRDVTTSQAAVHRRGPRAGHAGHECRRRRRDRRDAMAYKPIDQVNAAQNPSRRRFRLRRHHLIDRLVRHRRLVRSRRRPLRTRCLRGLRVVLRR